MKILYIDVNCKNSSTGNIVYNLYKCCINNGIESRVCFGRGYKVKEKNIYKFGLDLETVCHAILTRISGYTGCYSFFSTIKLIKYIKKFNPDIVHIHELHAYFVNVKQLLMFLKKNGIPTVFTNHCEFLYTGKCGHSKFCDKYSKQCGNCPLLKEYPKSIFFDRTRHMLETKKRIFNEWDNISIVSPSLWLDSKINKSFLKDKKRYIIGNSIDTTIFNYKDIAKSSKNKIILSVGPDIMSDNKGGKRVLEIAKLLPEFTFILIGDTRHTITDLNNVKIYPPILNKETLIKFYSNADCFLILSELETFPTTCIEAQCCGTKVIGYDVGGVKETILNNHGFVVRKLDKDSLVKGLKQILNSDYDKKIVSANACEYYSIDNMFAKYLTIYKKMIK